MSYRALCDRGSWAGAGHGLEKLPNSTDTPPLGCRYSPSSFSGFAGIPRIKPEAGGAGHHLAALGHRSLVLPGRDSLALLPVTSPWGENQHRAVEADLGS